MSEGRPTELAELERKSVDAYYGHLYAYQRYQERVQKQLEEAQERAERQQKR